MFSDVRAHIRGAFHEMPPPAVLILWKMVYSELFVFQYVLNQYIVILHCTLV